MFCQGRCSAENSDELGHDGRGAGTSPGSRILGVRQWEVVDLTCSCWILSGAVLNWKPILKKGVICHSCMHYFKHCTVKERQQQGQAPNLLKYSLLQKSVPCGWLGLHSNKSNLVLFVRVEFCFGKDELFASSKPFCSVWFFEGRRRGSKAIMQTSVLRLRVMTLNKSWTP